MWCPNFLAIKGHIEFEGRATPEVAPAQRIRAGPVFHVDYYFFYQSARFQTLWLLSWKLRDKSWNVRTYTYVYNWHPVQ